MESNQHPVLKSNPSKMNVASGKAFSIKTVPEKQKNHCGSRSGKSEIALDAKPQYITHTPVNWKMFKDTDVKIHRVAVLSFFILWTSILNMFVWTHGARN